jgi:adenine phosphoribosyltransferase
VSSNFDPDFPLGDETAPAAAASRPDSADRPDDIELVSLSALGPQRAAELRGLIRDIPGFPHDPIIFRDITPLLADGAAFQDVIEAFAKLCEAQNLHIDAVAGMEARGFVLGAPLATRLGVGFIPLRKAGKLPPPVHRVEYELEYGTAAMEVTAGTVKPGSRVLLVDDVLATGGTALAAAHLVERSGAKVSALVFLMELAGLGGAEKLSEYSVETLLRVG